MAEGTAAERRWNRSRYPLQQQDQTPQKTFQFHAAFESTSEPQQVHFDTIDRGGRDEHSGSESDAKENRARLRNLRRTKRSWQLSAPAPQASSEDGPIVNRSDEIEKAMLAPRPFHRAPNEPQSLHPGNEPKLAGNSETASLQSSLSGSNVSPSAAESIVQPALHHAAALPSEKNAHPDALHPHSQSPAKEPNRRRQAYPLQSLASVETLRYPQTPPSSPPASDDQQMGTRHADPREAGMEKANAGKKSRKAYPLQSFSSIANLQRPPSPPSSPESASRDSHGNTTDRAIDNHVREIMRKLGQYQRTKQFVLAGLKCQSGSPYD